VAGSFYPAEPARLAAAVDGYLAAAAVDDSGPPPKAIVAPHAGYLYSGPVAGSAFAALAPRAAAIRRVLLLGPSHYVAFDGLALARADAFRTPLGDLPVARALDAEIGGLPQLVVDDLPHEREHALEVELPFLQRLLPAAAGLELVPIVVGAASTGEVAEVIERLWGGDETAIVVSTDLSHYLDAAAARLRDEATATAIEALAPERIDDLDACGSRPLRGLLAAARARGLGVRRLDLRNSADTAGPADRVVGYGAFAFA
jgi:hypothetical protein